MTRRVNRRGWIVLVSIPSDDGAHCIDLFEWPTGGFAYQQFRSDAEDQGAWTAVGVPSADYPRATGAAAAAVANVSWLISHPRARRALEDWLATR